MIAQSVAKVLEANSDLIQSISSHAVANFFIEKKNDKREMDLSAFLELLKEEIEYILLVLEPLKTDVMFSLKRFDLWIMRLSRRALLWSAFKSLKIEINPSSLQVLKQSTLKPMIISNILEWLS